MPSAPQTCPGPSREARVSTMLASSVVEHERAVKCGAVKAAAPVVRAKARISFIVCGISTDLLLGLEKVMVMKDANNNRNEMLVSFDLFWCVLHFLFFWIRLIHFVG
mmetsp:Transcript_27058/g.48901  ORF Transcript_27058/g.48901 Transcript_27058/m.48901 type:complete len:107 (-) Transcript_27058:469-789(-)